MHVLLLGQEIRSLSIFLALGNHFQNIINKWHSKRAQPLISICLISASKGTLDSLADSTGLQAQKLSLEGEVTTFKSPRYQLDRKC